MKCLRLTAARAKGSGPKSETLIHLPLPTGDVTYVARVENHKAEWSIKNPGPMKKVEYISKSEYWKECSPRLREEHEARSAANKQKEQ